MQTTIDRFDYDELEPWQEHNIILADLSSIGNRLFGIDSTNYFSHNGGYLESHPALNIARRGLYSHEIERLERIDSRIHPIDREDYAHILEGIKSDRVVLQNEFIKLSQFLKGIILHKEASRREIDDEVHYFTNENFGLQFVTRPDIVPDLKQRAVYYALDFDSQVLRSLRDKRQKLSHLSIGFQKQGNSLSRAAVNFDKTRGILIDELPELVEDIHEYL